MKVRVSIGNLVPRVEVLETGQEFFVGILNSGAFKKGCRLVQPVGGAAHLTPVGRKFLEQKFNATDFHKSDARFVADDSHLEEIFSFFTNRDPQYFETDPTREIREELSTEELLGIPSVITAEEAEKTINIAFGRTVRQPFSDQLGTSPLAVKGIPSRRMFHLFKMIAPREIVEKMGVSEAITFLSAEEVATTNGGANKGATNNGTIIADNFIW